MPRLTTAQSEMYGNFSLVFDFCWACGFQWGQYRDWHYPRLENAHIVGGQGRRHDRRAIVRLCMGCHLLAHGDTVMDEYGDLFPQLSRANLVWLKSIYDPDHYDHDYLDGLAIGRIEDPEPLPGWFDLEFQRLGPVELRKARG